MAISAADILRQMRTQQELKAQMNKYKLRGDYQKASEIQKKLGTINFSSSSDEKSTDYAKAQREYAVAYTAIYDSNDDGRISKKEYVMKELSGLDSEYKSEYERLSQEKKLNPDEMFEALHKKFADKKIATSSFEQLNSLYRKDAKTFTPDKDGFINKEALGENADEYDVDKDGKISEKEYIMTKIGGEDAEFHNAREALQNKGLSSDVIYEKLQAQFGNKSLGGALIGDIERNQMLMSERLDANNNNDLGDEAAGYAKIMDAQDGQIDGKINSSLSEPKMEATLEGFLADKQSISEQNGEISAQQKTEIIDARTTYLYKDKENTSPEMMQLVNYETEVVRSGLRKYYGMDENRPQFGQLTSAQTQTAAPQGVQTSAAALGVGMPDGFSAANINAQYARIAQMGMMGTFGIPLAAMPFTSVGSYNTSAGGIQSSAGNTSAPFNPLNLINTSGNFSGGNISAGYSPGLGFPLTMALTGLAGGICGLGLGGLSYPGGGNFNRNLAYSLGFGALTIAPLMMMPSFTKF